MEAGTFALVPMEVVLDRRLTLEQLRVLIALFSFRSKTTDTVWPSRRALSERTGLHVSNISAATTALVKLGWLEKVGDGGCSTSATYRLCAPKLSTGVAEQATHPRSRIGYPPVAESATTPVAESARGKEHTNEHTNEHTKEHGLAAAGAAAEPAARAVKPAKPSKPAKDAQAAKPSKVAPAAAQAEKPEGVSAEVWQAFLALRRAKRAPLTPLALRVIEQEAVKAGVSLQEALETCCAFGWQGFRAEWLLRDKVQRGAGAPVLKQRAIEEHNRAVAEEWLRQRAQARSMGVE